MDIRFEDITLKLNIKKETSRFARGQNRLDWEMKNDRGEELKSYFYLKDIRKYLFGYSESFRSDFERSFYGIINDSNRNMQLYKDIIWNKRDKFYDAIGNYFIEYLALRSIGF